MQEINMILKAYSAAHAAGKKAALATVVKVEGSSYRQPGARMLVTEDGMLTGAISGGCLEGDALRKALLAISQKQNKLITYDTGSEDDAELGIQLGCNGIVHILFEYTDEEKENSAVQLLKHLSGSRREAVIVTLFSLRRNVRQIGTRFLYRPEDDMAMAKELGLAECIKHALQKRESLITELEIENTVHEALIEYISPPVSLVIAGAGNDVQPLVKLAALLGWEVTVGDGRATHSTPRRFPEAKKVVTGSPQQLIDSVTVDNDTFFVLMTHNYRYDFEILKLLLNTECRYIGILGPKTKLNRMIDDLKNEGIMLTREQADSIYGPVGLDIGAETSEEIALSVVAEIKAFKEAKKGSSLKYKTEKIHKATHVVSK